MEGTGKMRPPNNMKQASPWKSRNRPEQWANQQIHEQGKDYVIHTFHFY